jgi:hypothetical protein
MMLRAEGDCMGRGLRATAVSSAQNGQLMLKGDKLEFEGGAAAKPKSKDRNNDQENRYHDCDGTAGSRKSPAPLSSLEILSKDSQ